MPVVTKPCLHIVSAVSNLVSSTGNPPHSRPGWANFRHLFNTATIFNVYFSTSVMEQANFAHSDLHCCLLLFLKSCQLTQVKNFNLVEILTIEIDRLRAAGECEPVMTSSTCCDDVTLVCSLQKYRHHTTTVLCPERKSFINLKYSCIQCTGRSVTEMDVLYIQNFLDFFQPTVRLSLYFGGLVVSRGAWF